MIVNELKTKGSSIWDNVTPKAVGKRVMEQMRPYIGKKNAVSKEELFELVYELPQEALHSKLNIIALNNILSQAISNCRARSNCFIVSVYDRGMKYFVAKDGEDAALYQRQANNRISGLNRMKARAARSVEEKWHEQEWKFE